MLRSWYEFARASNQGRHELAHNQSKHRIHHCTPRCGLMDLLSMTTVHVKSQRQLGSADALAEIFESDARDQPRPLIGRMSSYVHWEPSDHCSRHLMYQALIIITGNVRQSECLAIFRMFGPTLDPPPSQPYSRSMWGTTREDHASTMIFPSTSDHRLNFHKTLFMFVPLVPHQVTNRSRFGVAGQRKIIR